MHPVPPCGSLWRPAVGPLKKIDKLYTGLRGEEVEGRRVGGRAVLCLGRRGGMTTEKAWGVGNSSETQLQCN